MEERVYKKRCEGSRNETPEGGPGGRRTGDNITIRRF
jgi:hypothetical protein